MEIGHCNRECFNASMVVSMQLIEITYNAIWNTEEKQVRKIRKYTQHSCLLNLNTKQSPS